MKNKKDLLKLKNIYDYAEYRLSCENPCDWIVYVQIAQTLLDAIAKYPELDADEAYLKIIKDNGNSMHVHKPIISPDYPVSNCSGCGGGTVK